MHSVKVRLIGLLLLVLSGVLGVFGLLGYQQAKNNGERDYQESRQALIARLSLSLPHGVWQLDEEFVRLTLDAELKSTQVVGLRVSGDAGFYLGRMRDAQGNVVPLPANAQLHTDEKLEIPIVYHGQAVLGKVEAYLTRGQLAERGRQQISAIVVQSLFTNLLLFVLLILALRRYVFAPLGMLQRSLDHATTMTAGSQIPELPTRWSEFSGLVAGINRIVTKINSELELRSTAEAQAQEAKHKAEQAYAQLVETQESLVRTEKMASLGGLVAGVAHEINTPVGICLTVASHLDTATRTLAERMAEGGLKKSDLTAYMTDAKDATSLILTNSERAANLIQSFKQVAVDQTSEERRTFILDEYIHEVITSLHPKLKRTGIEVRVECPPEIEMDSYPGALAQVVSNLVLNAVIHGYDEGKKGVINVTVGRDNGQVRMMVSDNGKGIPKENLSHIFEPFFTTRRGSGGSGLGLHIVYNIVFKHLGGQIEVQSQVGQGTVFHITMPTRAPAPETKEE